MQIVRTVLWVLLTVVLVLFAINNWQPVEVRVWNNLIVETRLAALAIAAFLLGLLPMWLFHRATAWRLRRRIAAHEATLASRSLAPAEALPSPAEPVSVEPAPAGPAPG